MSKPESSLSWTPLPEGTLAVVQCDPLRKDAAYYKLRRALAVAIMDNGEYHSRGSGLMRGMPAAEVLILDSGSSSPAMILTVTRTYRGSLEPGTEDWQIVKCFVREPDIAEMGQDEWRVMLDPFSEKDGVIDARDGVRFEWGRVKKPRVVAPPEAA